EHGHEVTVAIELVSRGKTGRARPDDGDALSAADCRRVRRDPRFGERTLDDGEFHLFDGDRLIVNAEHAGGFAGGPTHASCEFGKTVGRVQPIDRGAPLAAIDEVVPVRNAIAQRTSLMTERNAAVHAARGLLANLWLGQREVDLVPVVDAFQNWSCQRPGAA